MSENVLHVCGMSMEMELAEEMDWVGKCIGCLRCNYLYNGLVNCDIKGILTEEQIDCPDWIVDHR